MWKREVLMRHVQNMAGRPGKKNLWGMEITTAHLSSKVYSWSES